MMKFSIFNSRFLIAALGALCLCTLGFAQEASGAESIVTSITGLSTQQQLYVTWGGIALKYIAELYSSVRNGGGLRRILLSFWFGENLPKPVAKDYCAELNEPKKP